MRQHRHSLAMAVLVALTGHAAAAPGNDPASLLIEQGNYWQARNNPERASESWDKLLRLSPNQPDALYGLGLVNLQQHKLAEAQQYLARLQTLQPNPRQALQLEQDIALSSDASQATLAKARELAGSDKREDAVALYRPLFAGRPPQGLIAREYYNTLGFVDSGWPEARAGLERLKQERPEDSIVALFLAKHLVRHPATRPEGIRALAKLSSDNDVGGNADETRRFALIWLGPPSREQVPLFEQFLASHPDDAEIRALMNKGIALGSSGSGWQRDANVARGLKAIENGDLATAEQALQTRLKEKPGDTDATGALGVLRQRQNRLDESESLLQQAASKADGSGWKTALEEVRYWKLLAQAKEAERMGRKAQARDLIEQAIRQNPKQTAGAVALAGSQAKDGQLEQAEAGFRQVLSRQPNEPGAMSGLISVLSQAGRPDEALQLIDSLSPAEQAKLGPDVHLRSLRATQVARLADARGDSAAATKAFKDALADDPDNPWTHFALARLQLKQGRAQAAREQIDALLKRQPNLPDALYTRALLSAELGEWRDAETSLAKIPAAQRSSDMNEMAQDARLHVQTEQAIDTARRGQRGEALALLERCKGLTGNKPERVAILASAYVDAGRPDDAIEMMRKPLEQAPAVTPELQLLYAGVLLKADHDTEAGEILRDLQNASLTAKTRRQYDDQVVLYQIKQADRLREKGDLAAAYDELAPVLKQRPNDRLATAALARMYAANGEGAKAMALYKPLLQNDPRNPQLHLAVADLAVETRDKGLAQSSAKRAVDLAPGDPSTLTHAARVYRNTGQNEEATQLLRKSVAIEGSQRLSQQRQNPLAAIDENPFANSAQSANGARTDRSPAQQALDDILQARSAYVAQGVEIHSNDSESGLSKMTAVETPFEASMPVGESRVALRVTPVSLNAGSLKQYAETRFGGGTSGGSPGSQHDSGVGLAVAVENPEHGLKADLGVSPVGFLYKTLIGGVSVDRPVEGSSTLRYGVNLSRRPVTDSVTSFAGSKDQRTGEKWGGVTANGGRAQLSYDDQKVGAYGYAAYHVLQGNNVETNTRGELGAGIYWYLQNTTDTSLTIGLSTSALAYEKNQGYYTYGHGGYFSPQTFFAIGVPVSWSQRTERFSYQIKGSLGVQHIAQDAVDYFPGHNDYQARNNSRYASQSSTGIGYSLSAAGEYKLSANFALGARLGLDNARDYQDVSAGLYLRYFFEDQTGPMALPVSPYRSPYSE